MKCLSKNCTYKIHPNPKNNGGKYCCSMCRARPNRHGNLCEKQVFSAPVPDLSKNLKRALLVGINYIDIPRNRLQGCINDVINIQGKLGTANPECKDFKVLIDTATDTLIKPTRANIIEGINWLVNDLKSGESIYFHYSGHGGLTIDRSGDEISGKDSCIYPTDNGQIETITDDELRVMLVEKVPAGCKAFIVFDCCYSGSALDLRYLISAPAYGQINITQNNRYPATDGSVIFLSGCSDTQTAADTVNSANIPTGALTNALLDVWNQYGMNIKFKHMLWDIRTILKNKRYSQIPQLSCSSNINISDEFRL